MPRRRRKSRKTDVFTDGATDGLADIVARVDVPDALDFDTAVARVAEEQRAGWV